MASVFLGLDKYPIPIVNTYLCYVGSDGPAISSRRDDMLWTQSQLVICSHQVYELLELNVHTCTAQ